MQSDVNDYYDMFTSDVAKGRGVSQDEVKQGYGEGRMALAPRAVKLGLADKVEQLGDTVKRLELILARVARCSLLMLGGLPKSTQIRGERLPPSLVARLTTEERDRVLSVLAG